MVHLPFNTSCTYRAYSSCGYPVANMVTSGAITSDFDIAYATLDGVALDDEINGWNFTLNTQWKGSFLGVSSVRISEAG